MPDPRQRLGADGERAAEKFLRRQRYVILQRNYRCRAGEIDLIALDRSTVVFIEVKTRTHAAFGSPLEAVDPRKQRQIARASRVYIADNRLYDRNARFDVVGVCWEDGRAQCELVKNAFEPVWRS
jgi:putative endonuclease